MSAKEKYCILYFTTPFCGVCQSAKKIIEILATSLEIDWKEVNLHKFSNTFENLSISVTPSIALIYDEKEVLYYTENINNLTDLYQRIEQVMNQ